MIDRRIMMKIKMQAAHRQKRVVMSQMNIEKIANRIIGIAIAIV